MISETIKKAISITYDFLVQTYNKKELVLINNEINGLLGIRFENINIGDIDGKIYSYEKVQQVLSCLNEKESIRKSKGVYYTPSDLVEFILQNAVRFVYGKINNHNLHVMDMNGIPYSTFCYEKTIYDPTCGTGVFLLAALEMKLDLLDLHQTSVTNNKIKKIVNTIKGNDLNIDSTVITKIRIFLCLLYRYGASKIKGISKIINNCFSNYDFVTQTPNTKEQYDIIIGNPPYVEDSKSDSIPKKKYGNIYANVLENSALHLKPDGVLGFVIPLSYVSTPRMRKIRNELYRHTPLQYILSYSDRPDCLFPSVHQKLCVMFGKNSNSQPQIYTGNYRYWYREERHDLFNTTEVVKNSYVTDEYIPKLGTKFDTQIYKKIKSKHTPIIKLLDDNGPCIYLNMRAAFWIKAFLNKHNGSEYKQFKCKNTDYSNLCMCLLNSSLFWWYWICISDCWHITQKELNSFFVPKVKSFKQINKLAIELENRLEETKLYVGTKQTQYEYKHKECIETIHKIDDYINVLYGLTEEESHYIKNFAYRYRIGGGVSDERN